LCILITFNTRETYYFSAGTFNIPGVYYFFYDPTRFVGTVGSDGLPATHLNLSLTYYFIENSNVEISLYNLTITNNAGCIYYGEGESNSLNATGVVSYHGTNGMWF
jgi:hypothetical protein